MTVLDVVLVIAWGTLVGVDLVTAPQGLLSRPVVAATGVGLLLGDPAAGLIAGVTLELYALDVLPIGASRYPDYGIGAIAGGVAAVLGPPALSAGLAGIVGVPMALAGGWSLQRLRRRNAVSIGRRLERVASGDERAIAELQRNGFFRDAGRSAIMAAAGIIAAVVIVQLPWNHLEQARFVSWAAVAGGLAAALGGAARSAGAGARRRWLALGLTAGLAVVLVR